MILWTFAFTGVVMLVASFDPGFLTAFQGLGVLPVSTGPRVEMLVPRRTPFSQGTTTDLYFFEKDGSFTKADSFEEPIQCVTAVDGQLFITFAHSEDAGVGGPSSILKDGKWVRSVSAPVDFEILDVVSLKGKVYALGPTVDGTGIVLGALGEGGWQKVAEPFDVGKAVTYAGAVETEAGIEMVYGCDVMDAAGRVDAKNAKWCHVTFDGTKWGAAKALGLPAGRTPFVADYEGALAVLLPPAAKNEPVEIDLVKGDGLEQIAQVPTVDRGAIARAWLVPLADQYHVILVGPGKVWDVPLTGLTPGGPRLLLEVEVATLLRSRIYVGLMAAGAVLLVSLGVAWLVVRVRNIKSRGEQ